MQLYEQIVITFWTDLDLLPNEEPVLVYRKQMQEVSQGVDVAMDDSFFTIFLGLPRYCAEIHETATFDLVNQIVIGKYFSNHYLNGLIVTASTDNPWDNPYDSLMYEVHSSYVCVFLI